MSLHEMTAAELAERLAEGASSALEVADAFLARIEEREADLQAFAYVDPEHVRHQARALDALRQAGRPIGPLHGLPVALKDIIDTADMPTENGTVLDAGRRPRDDAHAVQRLRAAGAVILGKTATTELGYFEPCKTRNPHDPSRTPGGSSSGSAAAVAARMAPLALGAQTTGSVIRPAAFCGVVGFKPTHGSIARSGILVQAPPLDTVGVFGQTVEDAALIADCLFGAHEGDPDSRASGWPRLRETAVSTPPLRPNFAFVRQPVWEQAEDYTMEAFAELAEALGDAAEEVVLPDAFARGHDLHRTIMCAGFARSLGGYYNRGREQLSAQMRATIEEGRKILAHDYLVALDWVTLLNAGLDEIFERFDAIITPAAPGEAPSPETTGSPAFCTLWSLCGTPAVSLPLMEGPNGLPLGVQLVGPRGDDARLLRSANWLSNFVKEAG